jgi:hypothetical protein
MADYGTPNQLMIPFPLEQLAWGLVIPGGLKARPGIQSHQSAVFALDSRSLAPRESGMTTTQSSRSV